MRLVTIFPGLSDWGRHRLQIDTAVRRELWKDFFVALNLYDTFDSRRPALAPHAMTWVSWRHLAGPTRARGVRAEEEDIAMISSRGVRTGGLVMLLLIGTHPVRAQPDPTASTHQATSLAQAAGAAAVPSSAPRRARLALGHDFLLAGAWTSRFAVWKRRVCWRRGWVSPPASVAAKLDGTSE